MTDSLHTDLEVGALAMWRCGGEKATPRKVRLVKKISPTWWEVALADTETDFCHFEAKLRELTPV